MLIGRPVTGDFKTAQLAFTGAGEQFVANIYYHSGDVPTIGYGYALLIKNSAGKWLTNPSLVTDFSGIHTFSSAEIQLLNQIAKDKNAGKETQALADFNNKTKGQLSFTVSKPQAVDLYYQALERNIKAAKLGAIASSASMDGTHELIALQDLAYNSPALAVSSTLQAAVTSGNRPEAWCYFLTHAGSTDPKYVKGLENRRIKEANEFGLYSKGNASADAKESVTVVRYVDSIQNSLTSYMLSKLLPAATVTKFIDDSYAPGDKSLISAYGNGLKIANVVVAPNDKQTTINMASPPGYNKTRSLTKGNTLVVGGAGNDTLLLSGDLSSSLGSGATVLYYAGGGADVVNATGLKSNEAVEIARSAGTVNVGMGSNQLLKLDAPGQFGGTISGFSAGDAIDLAGVGTATSATLGANNVLAISLVTGTLALRLGGAIDYSQNSFDVAADGHGGTKITLGLKLDDLTISTSGGVQGFHQTYTATKGATYSLHFEPYSIPDSIKISDNKKVYVNSGMISDDDRSGPLSTTFTIDPNSNGKINVDVIGSVSGTAWELAVSRLTQTIADFSTGGAMVASATTLVNPQAQETMLASGHHGADLLSANAAPRATSLLGWF